MRCGPVPARERLSIRIRPARPPDAEDIARVHVRTWQAAYRGRLPADFLEGLSVDRRTRVWEGILAEPETSGVEAAFVAEDPAEGVVGFASAGPNRGGGDAFQAELLTLYVLPAFQARGLGRRLFLRTCEALRSLGRTSLIAWVLATNEEARGFYEALGGHLVGEREETFRDLKVPEVGYGWPALPKGRP